MKLVILGRDGVINKDSVDHIKSPLEWQPLPGSVEAIASLYQSGFKIVIATNQVGLAEGHFDMDALNLIHLKMHTLINQAGGKIEGIFFCPHSQNEQCDCRKPKPGLLNSIANRLQSPLNNIPFIGDSMADIEAGVTAGCQPMLVMTGKGSRTLAENQSALSNIPVYENLASAARSIISTHRDED